MNDGVPQYPWHEGDHLFASALNAAIANSGSLNNAGIANVLDFGADPTGIADSTTAFQEACASGLNVWAPKGTYRINRQLPLVGAQSLRGDGQNTILQIGPAFDPTVTTGVILLTPLTADTTNRPEVADLRITFEQPTDLVKTATSASAAGTNTVVVNSTSGIVVGMAVVDQTAHAAIPALSYFTAQGFPTTVTAIAGNLITLSATITSPGVGIGHSLQFGSVRSQFKTLAAGGTAGAGGTGIQYPWAIYANADVHIRNVTIQWAWNGVCIRYSAFQIDKLDVYAFNVGLDIDQCFNFPAINDYRFYTWGEPVTGGPRDAVAGTYYDGATVAANLGETDGVGVHNFQSWCGIVNLTSAWSWGSFTNLMLDGTDSNLNVLSTNGAGFVQITNCYSTKGVWNHNVPIQVVTHANFRTIITNLYLTNPSAYHPGVIVTSGILTLDDGYLWFGMQTATQPMIGAFGTGVLYLSNMQLDAPAGRTDVYINMSGTAALNMHDCVFTGAAGTGATAINGASGNPTVLSNITWNGWAALVAGNNENNGQVFVSPIDGSSMQCGSLSFAGLLATQHFCTAYGNGALGTMPNSATQNTAFGSLAGYGFGGAGSYNTFVGATSGFAAGAGGTGSGNTFLGAATGHDLTTGANNTFIGNSVGSGITSGSGNIFIAAGSDALAFTPTTSHTLLLGDNGIAVIRAINIDTASPKLFLDWLPATASYANDAAAATGGVGVGQLYRNGSAVMCRIV